MEIPRLYLMPLNLTLPSYSTYSPRFYHTKSIAPSKTQLTLLPKLKQRLFKISSIDEESGLLSANFHSFGSRRYSPATLQYTDFIFTWGDHDLNYLVSNFHLTGISLLRLDPHVLTFGQLHFPLVITSHIRESIF